MYKKIILLILITLFSHLSCYDGLLDTYDNSIAYNLRDRGPAGGWIFYINPNYKTDGWRYLEAAPASTEWTNILWSTPTALIGTTAGDPPRLAAIGTGKSNTAAIVAWLNANGQTGRAAQICKNLNFGGYSDWFMPSKDELNEMCWILHSRKWNGSAAEDNPAYETNRVGGFVIGPYWNSTEITAGGAWLQYFSTGQQTNLSKGNSFVVRAIRAF